MATVLDVASYILKRRRVLTTWKLQKLVYYCQAWSLVWDERPIFEEPIEAWANGPVVRSLYEVHRGEYQITDIPGGDPSALTQQEAETVEAVLEYYGDFPSQYLSDLTHMEDPWQIARQGTPPAARSTVVITHESMAEYYGSLEPDDNY